VNNQTFVRETEEFFRQCISVMNTKGAEYSGSDDKFANFKRLAAMQGLPIESIWLTYCTKHFDSIVSFVKKRNQGKGVVEIEAGLSEPIEGRILDMINYLAILRGIIVEEREGERGTEGKAEKIGNQAARNRDVAKIKEMSSGEFNPFYYRNNPGAVKTAVVKDNFKVSK
jgi:hypothetical protein